MKRSNNFSDGFPKVITVKDSRFGIRKVTLNKENPRIASYSAPGRGPNGEHQT